MSTDYRAPDRRQEQGVDLTGSREVYIAGPLLDLREIVEAAVSRIGYDPVYTEASELLPWSLEMGKKPAALVLYMWGRDQGIADIRNVEENIPILYIGDERPDDELKVSYLARGLPGKEVDAGTLDDALRELLGEEAESS